MSWSWGGKQNNKSNHSHHSNNANKHEVHLKNVSHLKYNEITKYINQYIHKRFIKLYNDDQSKHWILIVPSSDVGEWTNKLRNKKFKNTNVSLESFPSSGGGGGSNRKKKRKKDRQSAFSHNSNNKSYRTGKSSTVQPFTQHLTNQQNQQLLDLCGSRYDNTNKLLNLKGICENANERWKSFQNADFVKRLLDIIAKHCRDLKSLDLSNNNIVTLKPFENINEKAPCLENLCLLDNPIQNFSEINHLDSMRHTLCELYLQNSTLYDEVSQCEPVYVHEICRQFPSLRLLDGRDVRSAPLVSFGSALDELSNSMKGQCGNLPVSVHEQCGNVQMVQSFCTEYFNLFDRNNGNQRRKLSQHYHSDAHLTMTYAPYLDTPTPSEKMQIGNKEEMRCCNRMNRNLVDEFVMAQPRKWKMQRVKRGGAQIAEYWNQDFAKNTKHNMKWIAIDCHPVMVNGKQFMQVLLNGFYAGNANSARKFMRSWLLMMENSKIIIVNEQVWCFLFVSV